MIPITQKRLNDVHCPEAIDLGDTICPKCGALVHEVEWSNLVILLDDKEDKLILHDCQEVELK